MASAEAYLRTKWHLDPSNRFDTIDERYRQTRSIGRTVVTVAQKSSEMILSDVLSAHTQRTEYSEA